MFNWKWFLKDLPSTPTQIKVFSMFACLGGSSLGYKLAGCDVLGGVELDKRFSRLYQLNCKPRLFYNEDIRDFNRRDDLPSELFDLDILDGSPPCSSFSVAGNRDKDWGKTKKFSEGQKRQRLDDLVFEYCRAVEKLRPKVCVMENVTGLIKGKAKAYAAEILRRLTAAGYKMQLFRLNAALMGVPQTRERLFFIGNRMGFPPLKLDFNDKPILFGEVRTPDGKPIPPHTKAKMYLDMALEDDHDLSDVLQRVKNRRSYFCHTLYSDKKIGYTLKVKGLSYRLCDRTKLSDGDHVNIMSFPQDYDFQGYVTDMLGYSVPPVMMARIAEQILSQWFHQA